MAKIWIISDSHFNHQSIVDTFEFRPKNYGEQIIRKVKNNLKNINGNDLLIHLGDVIFDRPSELSKILENMGPCRKVLVKGNHDKNGIDFYINKGFDFVCDEFILKNHLGYNIIFSHKPKKDGELPKGFINIHGHLHTNSHHIGAYTLHPERYLLYSAEKENFMPLILTEMLKRIKTNKPFTLWEKIKVIYGRIFIYGKKENKDER